MQQFLGYRPQRRRDGGGTGPTTSGRPASTPAQGWGRDRRHTTGGAEDTQPQGILLIPTSVPGMEGAEETQRQGILHLFLDFLGTRRDAECNMKHSAHLLLPPRATWSQCNSVVRAAVAMEH